MQTTVADAAPKKRVTLAQVLGSTPVKGVLVGLAGGAALDAVSIALYDREKRSTWFAENQARGWKHAYERGVSKMARGAGKRLSRKQEKSWGWKFHQVFGVLTGLQYIALRKRNPKVGLGMGLLFGAAFFLFADELVVPLMGWTPGPRAFSWKVHARGAVAHVAYGVAAEAAARLLDRAAAAAV